jgi:hypothetical protein
MDGYAATGPRRAESRQGLLRAVFPDVDDHADVVIAENGAVLARGHEQRMLSCRTALDRAGTATDGDPRVPGGKLAPCDAVGAKVPGHWPDRPVPRAEV